MEHMKCNKNLSKQSGPRKRSKQSFKCNSAKPNYTLINPNMHKQTPGIKVISCAASVTFCVVVFYNAATSTVHFKMMLSDKPNTIS